MWKLLLLLIGAETIPQFIGAYRKTICEPHWGRISCPSNQGIEVLTANYGRTDKGTCRTLFSGNTNCRSPSALGKVKQACDGKTSCGLYAKNQYWGEPCWGTLKYLDITYHCVYPPVNGKWAQWSSFGGCSATCGGGTQTRTRTCTNPAPANGGAGCGGSQSQSQNCEVRKCPINGLWSAWSSFSTCSVSCGVGTSKRSRTCTNPRPAHGGAECQGESNDKKQCKLVECPINGVWSAWSSFSTCPGSCGVGGISKRSRTCTNPPPAHGGAECQGESNDKKECKLIDCPAPCTSTLAGNSGGSCCTLPFTYKGQTHHRCTDKGWHKFWCATTDNFDTDGKWGECNFGDSTCFIAEDRTSDMRFITDGGKYVGGHPCHFPFIYRGEQVNSCINTRHDRLWCGTTANYDTDGKWGNCIPGPCTHGQRPKAII